MVQPGHRASTTIFDSKQAEALGLKLEDKSDVKLPGGTIELAYASGVSFGLPGVEMRNQRVTLPLAIFTPVLGRPVHGMIGHDLFARFVVEIDYAARVINLYEAGKFSLERIRKTFTQNGRTFRLTVKRGGKIIRTKIKLRELI